MSSDKVTARPWVVSDAEWFGLSFGVVDQYGQVVAACREVTKDADLANAHLITAAPELYEALEIMLADYREAAEEWDPENQEYAETVIDQAHAALRKAKGGQPQ